MSTRFAAQWVGGAALLLGAIAVRAFTIPGAACWEGVHPTGYTAAEVGAIVIAGLLVFPSWGLVVAVEPRQPSVRWAVAAALLVELAAALALFAYLLGLPTYRCG